MGGKDWPLVGRHAELSRLLGHLDAGERGVILAGPAGAGKTRLADECLAAAVARGFVPIRVAATEATSDLPLGAFATLLPDLKLGLPRTEMLRRVARGICERGDGHRIALLVDDAHLLDNAGAALAHQLALQAEVFLLATIRSGEPVPSPLVALWKDGIAPRVDLPPLDVEQIGQLLAVVLSGPVASPTQHLLFERSAGNVLFLRELVLGALDVGALRNDGGLWRLEGALPPSDRLIELVEARMAQLDDRNRDVLELVAVGEPLGVELVERLTGRADTSTLERRQLVHIRQDGRRLELTLAHPIYGEVLRARLSPVRARGLSRALGDALEQLDSRRRGDLLRLAKWRLSGGGDVHPALMLAAANRAWTLQDLDLTEQFAQSALSSGGGFDAALLLAQVLSVTGRGDEAERRMATLEPDAATDSARAQLAIARIDNLSYNLGRPEAALAVAEQADKAINESTAKQEVAAYRASLLDVEGHTAALATAASLSEQSSGRALAWASAMAAWGYAKTGQLTKSLAMSEQGLAAHMALTGPPLPMGPDVQVGIRTWSLTLAGQFDDAETLALGEYRQAVGEGAVETQWLLGANLAMIAVARGQIAAGARWGREAASLARRHGRLIIVKSALIPLAEALSLVCDTEAAEAVIADLHSPELTPIHMLDAEVARVHAWLEVSRGDLTAARKRLTEAAAIAATSGDLVWESAALHDTARLGRASQVIDRLGELAQLIEGPLVGARLGHARALVRSDPTGLAVASEAFEDIGALLLAAEATADAAAAWQKEGDQRRATAAQRRAVHLAARCEGARTPALAVDTRARATLTRRELETARLAASGKPNKVIAQILGLSLRTVENKLHDAYEKLGIFGREDLAPALEGLRLQDPADRD